MNTPRFITDPNGKRVEVILDLESYQKFLQSQMQDENLLIGVSDAELRALAKGKLATDEQERLSNLIRREKAGDLSPEETQELDTMLEDLDQLNLLKAKALYTLKVRQEKLALTT
jgi:hypothetical protein